MKIKRIISLCFLFIIIVGCSKSEDEKYMDCVVASYALAQDNATQDVIQLLKSQNKNFSPSTLNMALMNVEYEFKDSSETSYINSMIKQYNSSSCQSYHKQGKFPFLLTPFSYYILYPFW